jgi:hypothetical protein
MTPTLSTLRFATKLQATEALITDNILNRMITFGRPEFFTLAKGACRILNSG